MVVHPSVLPHHAHLTIRLASALTLALAGAGCLLSRLWLGRGGTALAASFLVANVVLLVVALDLVGVEFDQWIVGRDLLPIHPWG